MLIESSLLESAYSGYGPRTLDRLHAAAKRYRINTEKIAEDVACEFAAKRTKQEKRRKERKPDRGSGGARNQNDAFRLTNAKTGGLPIDNPPATRALAPRRSASAGPCSPECSEAPGFAAASE